MNIIDEIGFSLIRVKSKQEDLNNEIDNLTNLYNDLLAEYPYIKDISYPYNPLPYPNVTTVYGCPNTFPINYPNIFKNYEQYVEGAASE